MELERAERIVNSMARERYRTVEDVLQEFLRYQKHGEARHFWPDENTACLMLVKEYRVKCA